MVGPQGAMDCMFDAWCDINEAEHGKRKTLVTLGEKKAGRDAIKDELAKRVRSHYDDLEQIAEDVQRLGFPAAAKILKERLPRTPKARSGEMGEVLATEFMEYYTDFRIPVRRLRYKDGREMALRGDDFLGISEDEKSLLYLLKGESKSGINVTNAVIAAARRRLSDDSGRPTTISLLFVADRLLESNGADRALGRRLRDEVALNAVPPRRTTHGLFTLSRNTPNDALTDDLKTADQAHNHISVNLCIQDHQAFIANTYDEAGALGDD